MTNQSREAFEKWFHGFGWNVWSEELKDWMWQAWQAALSEGRRLGIEEAAKLMEFSSDIPDCGHWKEEAAAIRALMVKEGKV